MNRDRTVSFKGTLYEVDAALVGQTVTLLQDPDAPRQRRLPVSHQGRAAGFATILDAYANTRVKRAGPSVVFQFVSVDFTKLFHELVRSLFELVHYCRRELRPGKGPVEPYVSVKLATVTLSCSSELIHKIPRPCIGII